MQENGSEEQIKGVYVVLSEDGNHAALSQYSHQIRSFNLGIG
ncbi:MAG: hypothetical protein ACLU8F_07060 [Clostridia bacterium]